jgi:hypothetical protein
LEEIDYKLRRKELLLNQSKDNQKRCEVQDLVTKLCALAGIEASEDNVGKCELVYFDKLKAAELKAFIIACHPKFMKISEVAHLKIQEEENRLKRLNVELIIASQLHLGLEIKRADCRRSHICMMILT